MSLYWHALSVAQPRQLTARALRPWRRRRFPRAEFGSFLSLTENEALWRSPAFAPTPTGVPAGSRLARFESHYGEDVLAAARAGEDAAARARAWIQANPPGHGDAWHPYPLSTRVANWIAAATLDIRVAAVVGPSLAHQLAYLQRNVEHDILGNHLIRNAKALVLGGLAVRDDALRRHGLALLERELTEQVLPDGGHYERSPAYHRLVLRDLLELRPYARVEREIDALERFAAASSRPDGAPALFNDGGRDIAPELDLPDLPVGLASFEQTGYVFLRDRDLWLAFDCGPPAPDFLPAHAHADALSFQLWLGGREIVADPGTSTYEQGDRRDWERGTQAHSTVAVDGDQFRLWGAFRSGPLPRVRLVEATPTRLEGQARLPNGVMHTRTIEIGADEIAVRDRIEGSGRRHVVSSLPLGSDATVSVEGSHPVREVESTIAQRFGELQASRRLVMELRALLPVDLGWTIARR